MVSGSSDILVLNAIAGTVLILAGIVLLRRGWFARRVGDTPHCPRCDYSLAGIALERCPECGTAMTAGEVVRGERVRRPGMSGAGAILLVIGLAFTVSGFSRGIRRLAWYRYKPTTWLIADTGSADASVREDAWEELAERDRAGRLSAAQRDRFYRGAFGIVLRARRQVVAGEKLPLMIDWRGRGPETGWFFSGGVVGMAIDAPPPVSGSPAARRFYETFSRFPGGSSSGHTLPVGSPGEHVINVAVDVSVYRGGQSFPDPDSAKPVWTGRIGLSSRFSALAPGTGETVSWIEDAALKERVRRAIEVEWIWADKTPQAPLSASIRVENPPVSVAFNVIARYGGKEYPMGPVYARAHDQSVIFGPTCRDFPSSPDIGKVDVVFRASKEVAKETVDLFQLWRGEIVFRDVEVRRARR